MVALKWIVLGLARFQGGWLVFDGGRALIIGDYVTPVSGPRAGQLGLWSRIVSAAGFQPRSTAIKCLHLVLGIAWLTALVFLLVRPATGWSIALCCAVASFWYLPIGTVASFLVILLLLTPQLRRLS